MENSFGRMKRFLILIATCFFLCVPPGVVLAGDLQLQDLIDEALTASPEIQAARAKAAASGFRVPQAMSLPDPMVMAGYQNEGTDSFTFNEAADSQFMFSASQQFFFPGKQALKGEAAAREEESLAASSKAVQLRTIVTIKELYYDLFLAHQSMDLVREKGVIFRTVEDAALARYASGGGMQQDVLMAQTEKYMLLEREEMLKQKIQTLEAALSSMLGREQAGPLGRPVAPVFAPYPQVLPDLIAAAYENSPEIKAREKMVASLETKVRSAERDYYPDITVTGNYGLKGSDFEDMDMWSLTTTVNIPLYYTSKQRPAVQEAEASLAEAKNELQMVRLRLSAAIRENYTMVQSTERLMAIYRQGLSRKLHQEFQAALASYASGKTDALSVISRLKTITEIETSYWGQMVEREKAKARLEALSRITEFDREEGR